MTSIWKCMNCHSIYTTFPQPSYWDGQKYITNYHSDCIYCGNGFDAIEAQN